MVRIRGSHGHSCGERCGCAVGGESGEDEADEQGEMDERDEADEQGERDEGCTMAIYL